MSDEEEQMGEYSLRFHAPSWVFGALCACAYYDELSALWLFPAILLLIDRRPTKREASHE